MSTLESSLVVKTLGWPSRKVFLNTLPFTCALGRYQASWNLQLPPCKMGAGQGCLLHRLFAWEWNEATQVKLLRIFHRSHFHSTLLLLHHETWSITHWCQAPLQAGARGPCSLQLFSYPRYRVGEVCREYFWTWDWVPKPPAPGRCIPSDHDGRSHFSLSLPNYNLLFLWIRSCWRLQISLRCSSSLPCRNHVNKPLSLKPHCSRWASLWTTHTNAFGRGACMFIKDIRFGRRGKVLNENLQKQIMGPRDLGGATACSVIRLSSIW